jgi:hypothetical protein
MDDSRRSPHADDEHTSPGPEATAAGAVAPPPRSARTLRLFLDVLVLVPCGVAGVLLPFTAVPVGYAVLLLVATVLAAVDLGTALRRNARRGRG